jgi:hypothetical protein
VINRPKFLSVTPPTPQRTSSFFCSNRAYLIKNSD